MKIPQLSMEIRQLIWAITPILLLLLEAHFIIFNNNRNNYKKNNNIRIFNI